MNTQASELRSEKPSLLMRLLVWILSKRKRVFPETGEAYRAEIASREMPRDAAIPNSLTNRFTVEHWMAAGHPVVTVHPKSGPGDWHMLYFHGGGFVLPMFKEHWPLVAAMVEKCGVSVSVPMYPVVPEHAGTEQDAVADAAFRTLAERHDPARIVLNGDSAGGHMALALALRLARAEGSRPGKLALFAPWLDLTMADPAMEAVEPHDIMLRIGTLRACGDMYAGDRDVGGAECSPLYTADEDLAKLPPTRIWTGRHDLFIVDSRSLAKRLVGAGMDAKLYEYEAAPHVFMALVPTRESKDVMELLGDWLQG